MDGITGDPCWWVYRLSTKAAAIESLFSKENLEREQILVRIPLLVVERTDLSIHQLTFWRYEPLTDLMPWESSIMNDCSKLNFCWE
ncbi:hypothetical protein Y032_0075g913 [Ancylostoma ceylanicum]|uniref:Uncharacterized protein n=1 Tax=Ancylostoma ceylanicum TaxID=53326 RepID=A0A016TVS9_9BILA|nr:hypothetical protein Y032_0075g913 [Ancylostoma ceylanicum]